MIHFGKEIFERIKVWAISWLPAKGVIPPDEPSEVVNRSEMLAEKEAGGAYYFKRDILDQLKEYFRCISYIKKSHPDAYSLYSKVGASLMPVASVTTEKTLPTIWRSGARPSFGAVAFLSENSEKTLGMKFGCFRKFGDWLPSVEMAPGTLYEIIVFFVGKVKKDKKSRGIPIGFYVAIDDAGSVTLLKEWQTDQVRVQAKSRISRRCGKEFYLPNRVCRIPGMLIEWAEENNETPQEFAKILVSAITNFHASSNSHVRVECSRRKHTAVFGVDMLRTPYFFSDREPVLAPDDEGGHVKRIFHIVKTHKRIQADGSEGYVKSHFRGIRNFVWNGYHVNVTVPEYHHAQLVDLEAGAVMIDDDSPVPSKYITEGEMADKVRGHIANAAREAAWKDHRKAS